MVMVFGGMVAAGGVASDMAHIEKVKERDKVTEAVDKGLSYLVSQQDPVLGSFKGDKPNTLTALACMALMAAGHFPERSAYGENLRRGVMFLAKATKKNKGYLGQEGNARMYGHGICTLAMCEAYGMMGKESDNRKVREAIERAIKVVLNAQVKVKNAHHGGWRYNPTPSDADLSPTSWQILALRSAQNCQLAVPDKAIDDALNYVRRTYHAGSKGFAYQPGSGPSVAMKSAGVVCMNALGANKEQKDLAMLKGSANYLLTLDPANGGNFYYQSYYLATAANMMGPEYREVFLPKMEKVLIGLQMPSGEFRKHTGNAAGVYSTAFGVICLCVNYQYLPIYQE